MVNKFLTRLRIRLEQAVARKLEVIEIPVPLQASSHGYIAHQAADVLRLVGFKVETRLERYGAFMALRQIILRVELNERSPMPRGGGSFADECAEC